MNTSNRNQSPRNELTQTMNNTTGWIGRLPGNKEHISRGQTFTATSECDLEKIEVFSTIVQDQGHVVMTVHNFDPTARTWGPVLGTSSMEVRRADSGKWLSFSIPALHLNKGKSYGFKIDSQDACIGVGEAAGSSKHPPFDAGQEWKFTNNRTDTYSYFSLAFKLGITA